MRSFLKKLFNPIPKLQPTTTSTLNQELITQLTKLTNYSNLNQLFLSPINKIYVINTYTTSFNDLLSNLYSISLNRTIIAINLHSYFSNINSDISSQLTKLISHLSKTKLSSYIEHDLFQLCSTFDDLIEMEKNNV